LPLLPLVVLVELLVALVEFAFELDEELLVEAAEDDDEFVFYLLFPLQLCKNMSTKELAGSSVLRYEGVAFESLSIW